MATTAIERMAEDYVRIREVQTATLRRQGTDENWSVIVSVTEPIRQAGLADGGSFQFDPESADELGMVLAMGSEEIVDGRSRELTRNIKREGADESTLRLVLPDEVLSALEIDPDAIDWDDPPEVSVWAGDRLLAFERPGERTVPIDHDQGVDQEDEGARTGPSSGRVGPILFANATARQQLVEHGEVITFRSSRRTTGETWWRKTRTGEKQGDVLVEHVTAADPSDPAQLSEYVDRSGFDSVGDWQAAIEAHHGGLSEGHLYRVTDLEGDDNTLDLYTDGGQVAPPERLRWFAGEIERFTDYKVEEDGSEVVVSIVESGDATIEIGPVVSAGRSYGLALASGIVGNSTAELHFEPQEEADPVYHELEDTPSGQSHPQVPPEMSYRDYAAITSVRQRWGVPMIDVEAFLNDVGFFESEPVGGGRRE